MSNMAQRIEIPLELLREIQCALNDLPNTPFSGERWTSTYALAAELSRYLRSVAASGNEPAASEATNR